MFFFIWRKLHVLNILVHCPSLKTDGVPRPFLLVFVSKRRSIVITFDFNEL